MWIVSDIHYYFGVINQAPVTMAFITMEGIKQAWRRANRVGLPIQLNHNGSGEIHHLWMKPQRKAEHIFRFNTKTIIPLIPRLNPSGLDERVFGLEFLL